MTNRPCKLNLFFQNRRVLLKDEESPVRAGLLRDARQTGRCELAQIQPASEMNKRIRHVSSRPIRVSRI